MKTLPPELAALPITVRAEMAMRAAARKVLIEHARDGMPIYIWRDGKVVALDAREELAREALVAETQAKP